MRERQLRRTSTRRMAPRLSEPTFNDIVVPTTGNFAPHADVPSVIGSFCAIDFRNRPMSNTTTLMSLNGERLFYVYD